MASKLTPYGPGKFRNLVDCVAWSYTMEGAHDDETGESESVGWFGVIFGAVDPEGFEPGAGRTLSEFDRRFLADCKGGAIVSENSDGFVFVDYFSTDADIRAEWERIVERVSEALADCESDPE